jgi:hypothetical protein
MEHASCAHLVATWWNGEELKDCVFWGHKILIWGRYGKFVEFLAALVIVVDIIGEARLNAFARKVDQAVAYSSHKGERAIAYILKRFSEAIGFFFVFASQRRRKAAVKRAYRFLLYVKGRWYRLIAANLISALVFFLFEAVLIASGGLQSQYRLPIGVVASILLLVPFVAYMLAVLLVNALYLRCFRFLLIQPAIWVFSRPYVATLARIVSLAVLIAGFSLDMLAS